MSLDQRNRSDYGGDDVFENGDPQTSGVRHGQSCYPEESRSDLREAKAEYEESNRTGGRAYIQRVSSMSISGAEQLYQLVLETSPSAEQLLPIEHMTCAKLRQQLIIAELLRTGTQNGTVDRTLADDLATQAYSAYDRILRRLTIIKAAIRDEVSRTG